MTSRPILGSLVLAALMLAAAAIIKYGENTHLFGPHMAACATGVTIGLMLAFIANFMPKSSKPRSASTAGGRSQAALRVGGSSFLIAGLAYAGISAFAPLDIAADVSMVVVGAAMVITLGYAIWCMAAPRDQSGHSVAGE
jgi:hypothetical protein